MIRFLLNAVGAVLLAVALVFAVSDIAASLAQDTTRLTPLADAFAAVGFSPAPAAGRSQSAIDFIALVSAWPAALALGGAAFLFLFLGRSPRRPVRRLSR